MSASVVILGWPAGHSALKQFVESVHNASLNYYASEVFKEIGYGSLQEFDEAMNRTILALHAAQIPEEKHLRLTFRVSGQSVFKDWKISDLSRHLIMINGKPSNGFVARYQIKCMNPNTKI